MPRPYWMWLLAAAALATGLYARFKGIGEWPFGVDEYYISRSIDFILRSGVPEFLCGGYYPRGILYQYVIAGLRMAGMQPEFAARLITALSSVAVLPAAYLLGTRLHGRTVGLTVVVVLALSVWEVEMARFARMYMPFQAVFAWYVLYFLRLAIDRDRKAAVPLLLLSILGASLWEGGVLLGIANFLPLVFWQRDGRWDVPGWKYLVAAGAVFCVLLLAVVDWRYHSDIPAFAVGYHGPSRGALSLKGLPSASPGELWPLAIAALPALLAAVMSVQWLWSLRRGWGLAAGLSLALVAALASQTLLAAAILLTLVLSGLLAGKDLRSRGGIAYLVALLLATLTWTGHALIASRRAGSGVRDTLMAVVDQLVGRTDVVTEVLVPWAATVPVLTCLLAAALAGLTLVAIRRGAQGSSSIACLLVLVIVLLTAVGASGPPRHETRYTFFLFPVLVTLGVTAVALAVERVRATEPFASMVTVAAALLLFAVSGDFKPQHLVSIDTAATNFREGLSRRQMAHLYPRSDFRAAAQWLTQHARSEDVVISGVPPIAQYYQGVEYSFLDEQDDRYGAFACARGTQDRWSALPLLHTTAAVEALVLSGARAYVVLYPDREARLRIEAAKRGWNLRTEWPTRQRDIAVLVIN